MNDPSLRRASIRHRLEASTSFVLASLRALHVDPAPRDDGLRDQGGKGKRRRRAPEHRRCRTDPVRSMPSGYDPEARLVRGTYLRIADLRFRSAYIRVAFPRSTSLRCLPTSRG